MDCTLANNEAQKEACSTIILNSNDCLDNPDDPKVDKLDPPATTAKTVELFSTPKSNQEPVILIPNAVKNTIKSLTKQIKSKISDRPDLLDELNSIRVNNSGVDLLNKLKAFKLANIKISEPKNIIPWPNPGNWPYRRLAKFYAHFENEFFITGLEMLLKQPDWVAEVMNVGRAIIKMEEIQKRTFAATK